MERGRTRLPEGTALDKPIVVRVNPGLRDQVDELAAEKDVSRAWIARRALTEYVERERGN